MHVENYTDAQIISELRKCMYVQTVIASMMIMHDGELTAAASAQQLLHYIDVAYCVPQLSRSAMHACADRASKHHV